MRALTCGNGREPLRQRYHYHPLPMRSDDETAFHLMPTSLSAVYRFTWIADTTVVPIVPYAKLGLSITGLLIFGVAMSAAANVMLR